MADLSSKDSSLLVGVVGVDSTTSETNPVNATTGGGLHTNLRDAAGSELAGQKVMTSSVPVVIASNQTAVPISTTQLPSALSNDNLKTEVYLPANYSRAIFGGVRVVTTQSVFESLFSFDKQPLIWDEVLVTGGTSTFNANTNSIDMTTSTASGASVIRQAFHRIRYNPARACQLIAGAVMGAEKTNVRKRIGQFDDLDGLFFEQDGTGLYVVRRTSTSGSAVDVRTPRASWNIDKLDGTGPSGVTLDLTKQNGFYIQYAFQGFVDITYGFYLNGQITFCHREQTGNLLNQPFMRTAHLPARVEITNTGVAVSPTTLSYNSFTAKNEGEDSDVEGQVRSYSSSGLKTVGTSNTPVISIRLGSGYQRAVVDVLSAQLLVQTVDEVIWTLLLSPTLTGPTFAITRGYVQLDTAATALSGGTELISGLLSQNVSSASVSQDLLKLMNSLIGSGINGTSQVITLAARSRIGTADVLPALVWREYP